LVELKNWRSALGNVDLKNIGLIFIKFATGRLSWLPKWSYYLAAGIPTAIIWLFVVKGMWKNKLLAFLFVFPLIIGLIISFWMPMMMYFRFLYLIPIMCLLLVEVLKKRLLKFNLFILSIYLIFSFIYLLLPQFHREDWKGLSQGLSGRAPVYMIIPSSDPITYYRSDVSVYELRTVNKSVIPETIQVIPYTSNLYGIDYESILQRRGCIKESQASFRGDLLLERWKCMRNA
jgi:hypothetical protein